tara:strand:+ start:246 stop:410 length:165 start_codon:yes stop_codon:yes gene_type:complete
MKSGINILLEASGLIGTSLNTNSINGKKNCVYFKKKSIKVIQNYLRKSLSEKKL